MKKKILSALAALGFAPAVFAQSTTTVDPNVTQTISELEAQATAYANAIAPFVKNVGIAFLAIAAIAACFGVILWGLKRARPGR